MSETERNPVHRPEEPASRETANDTFKRFSANWTKVGLISAAVLHFGLFELVRPFEAKDLGIGSEALEAVQLPPQVEIPPPPEQISRPATPRVATVEVSEDVTIAPTTFETNPVENLPPPPTGGRPSDRPSFIPYDTPPKLQNTREIQRLLQRYYPQNLKEAGIGGKVELWIYVDATGSVQKSQVKTSSGNLMLDEAAGRVAGEMAFLPAKNRDRPTDVWVSQWITFEVI